MSAQAYQVAPVIEFPLSRAMERRLTRARYGATGLKGLRLTRRGRVIVVLLAVVVALGIFFVGSIANAEGVRKGVAVGSHPVVAGDTLWSIARGINPGMDNRDVVADIMELNGINSGAIAAGDVLYVPLYAD